MKLNLEIGKIYDTLFFLIEYYNADFIEQQFESAYPNVDIMKAYFAEVKENVDTIPAYLVPFFYVTSDHPSILSALFIKNFCEINGELQNLLEIIRNDRETLRSAALSLFLDDSNVYNGLMQSSSLSADQVAFLFGRFDQAIDEMCSCLEVVYHAVDNLHAVHRDIIETVFEQNSTDTNKQLLNECMNISTDEIENAAITYSLLNQYLILRATTNNSIILLLGIKYDVKEIVDYDSSLTSADHFLTVCSGELRVKMLHALIDHGELTGSQMAKLIGCPPTTLIRPISILQENKLIYISRKSGLQIFYRLNIPLFRKIYRSFNTMFKKIIDKEN